MKTMKMANYMAVFLLLNLARCQYLFIEGPQQLSSAFKSNEINVKTSPLGLKPKSGMLHGRLKLASPLSACSAVKPISQQEEEDTFLLADDTECLESVKARNLAASGAYLGVIKKNINNTLHDRQINIVHIPILDIEPNHFQVLLNFMKKNPEVSVSITADFSSKIDHKKITIELWLSPTDLNAYFYILKMKQFIEKQPQQISFQPKFVLQSQISRKQYIGCLSSGRFCPPDIEYDGRPEGAKIVEESLRQIIINQYSTGDWWKYASHFSSKCLRLDELWQGKNSEICSQNSMLSQGINSMQIFKTYNASFLGNRPQVDGNVLLEQQRQQYISQKITHHPVLLVNSREYTLNDGETMKLKICTMIHPDPNQQTAECQKLTKPKMFSNGEIMIYAGVIIVIMIVIMVIYKFVIHMKMKKEMKREVDKTLTQYYRYMETFEEPDQYAVGRVPLVEPKIETNEVGEVELPEIKQNS